MGDIKKVLALSKLPYRYITPNRIWTDLCEDIHLHYRNFRFDFSEDEWAKVRAAVFSCGMQMERACVEQNWKEGDPNYLVQFMFNDGFGNDSDHFANRLSIEWQRDNTVHVHYRDLRIHLAAEEFRLIAEKFGEALKAMDSHEETKFAVEEVTRLRVPIDDIQPYDSGHLPGVIDREHRQGIDFIKAQIELGRKIRPILVNKYGQRLDGFKRYMAFKELGHTEIDVVVDPFTDKLGGQGAQGLYDEEGSDV